MVSRFTTDSNDLETKLVVDGVSELLFTAQVALGCLHRNVPEKELDLFQFPAGQVAETRAGPAKIMGCQIWNPGSFCSGLDDVSDCF